MNNSVDRQKKIVEILKMLHEGDDFETAKQIFDATFDGVDVSEITSAERELIASGLNPMEIQNLCNVHAAVFRGKINPNQETPTADIPGHPVQVLKLENMVLMSLINDELLPTLKKWQQDGDNPDYLARLQQALRDLATIDKHYARKENLIFPLMDKYGITAPPKVMWGVDDEIRGWIKDAHQLVMQQPLPDKYAIEAAIEKAAKEVDEMVFKEEEIMLPMVLEVFTPSDWGMVAEESAPIGYTLIAQPLPWHPTEAQLAEKPKVSQRAKELNAMAQVLAESQDFCSARKSEPSVNQTIAAIHADAPQLPNQTAGKTPDDLPPITIASKPRLRDKQNGLVSGAADQTRIEIDGINPAKVLLPTGSFDLDELMNVLRILPLDLTFVDANDTVKWFSNSEHRIFPRTTAVIGRLVVNCHPPKSVDRVIAILEDFHSGKRDHADFWFNMRGKTIYIRYFAVRDTQNNYLGCLEVSQDITEIQQLEGEKRL
ncbi:DUF438 domain-containing protein [Lacticaseibacillus saniviri]|nr:DUF438 domain-containing protein [Lacticaseibacillus saniviri]MCG4282909.1 DUF438 domain-containing protein [Lacticaseibacillus saniviri]